MALVDTYHRLTSHIIQITAWLFVSRMANVENCQRPASAGMFSIHLKFSDLLVGVQSLYFSDLLIYGLFNDVVSTSDY